MVLQGHSRPRCHRGRRAQVTRRGFQTAAEAAKARRELLAKVDAGEVRANRSALTVTALLDEYLDGLDADRRLSARTRFDQVAARERTEEKYLESDFPRHRMPLSSARPRPCFANRRVSARVADVCETTLTSGSSAPYQAVQWPIVVLHSADRVLPELECTSRRG